MRGGTRLAWVVITDRDYHERYLGYVIQNSDVFLYSTKLYFNR